MPGYVKTDTVLDKILANTEREVAARKADLRVQEVIEAARIAPPPRDMISALRRGEYVSLLAEVKAASPSRGVLVENFDPVLIGKTYADNGASGISVLTDEKFFRGHLDYLEAVRDVVDIPVLRKDFIIDAYQVYEARAAGADCVLLIVAALDDVQLADLYTLASELGMSSLVEIYAEEELDRAMKVNPKLLGVNNRDLKTFNVDLQHTGRIIGRVPGNVTFVAESGMLTTDDVRLMGELGAHAVLIGEGLVTSGDIPATVRSFSRQPRKAR